MIARQSRHPLTAGSGRVMRRGGSTVEEQGA